MYYIAKMVLDEESRQATGLQEPRAEERARLHQESRSRERAGLEKEPVKSKRETLFRRKWFKGAPAREHGAGSRANQPDAFAVSPSLREGPTSGFESPIPG